MNPIKSITLENFQSHQKTTINPAGPGQLTVITGCSDSGKTAIIRALKWVFFNQPQGDEFTRIGASMVRVTLEYADGVSVVRERTKATNRYKIIQPGASESGPEVFEGFGGGVPLEVQEITGAKTVKMVDQDLLLNLSEQLDPPFLGQKSTSAPGRAKILGKLAGTEEIDVAGAETGKDLYRRGQDEKRLGVEIGDLGTKIQEYAWVESLGQRIEILENLVTEMNAAKEMIIKLSTLKSKFESTKTREAEAQEIILHWINLPKAEKLVIAAEKDVARYQKLTSFAGQIQSITMSITTTKKIISRWTGLPEAEKNVFLAGLNVEKINRLAGLQKKLLFIGAEIEREQKTLSHLSKITDADTITSITAESLTRAKLLLTIQAKLNGIESQREKLFETVVFYDVRIPELQEQYIEELVAAKICPTCGQKIEKIKLKEAI